MMRRLALLAACGSHGADPPHVGSAPAQAPVTPVADAAPAVETSAWPSGLTPLGAVGTWTEQLELIGVAWCPGDREIVTYAMDGRVRRYAADTGKLLNSTPVGHAPLMTGGIDCRADGAALVVAPDSIVVVARDGTVTKPPSEIEADSAVFADDGSVLALATPQGRVMRWRGAKVERAYQARSANSASLLAVGGAYVEVSSTDTWVLQGSRTIHLSRATSDLGARKAAIAADGSAFVIATSDKTEGWRVSNGSASKAIALGQRGANGVAVLSNGFLVSSGFDDVVRYAKPDYAADPLVHACGEQVPVGDIAAAATSARAAINCFDGLRVYDLDSKARLDTPTQTSSARAVAWSPSGKLVATAARDEIRVWNGTELVTHVPVYASALWWNSETELGGRTSDGIVAWSLPAGTQTTTGIAATDAAHSAHGELVVADDRESTLAIVRDGKATPIAIPAQPGGTHVLGVAINDAGTHAVLWRGSPTMERAFEVFDVDVRAATATPRRETVDFVAVGDKAWAGFAGNAIVVDGKKVTTHDAPTTLALHGDAIAIGDDHGDIAILTLAGEVRATKHVHDSLVRALAWSPDGKRLASAGDDGTFVWAP